MLGKDYDRQDCLLARALELVGERWTLLIVRDAFFGVRRFSDFRDRLDIPKAVLADRLKGLVEAGVMRRVPETGHSRQVTYELTDAGRALWPAVYALRSWAARYIPEASSVRVFVHEPCGRELDDAGRCACSDSPEPEQILTSLKPGAGQLRDDPVSVALAAPRHLLTPLEAG